MLTKSASLFTVVLLATSMVLHAQAPSLTPLGDLPGGAFHSEAHAVSGDGSVVVGWGSIRFGPDRNHPQAFRWTAGGGMVGLVNHPDYRHSFAAGASADGSVVVGSGQTHVGPEAFRWTSGGGMVALGDPGASRGAVAMLHGRDTRKLLNSGRRGPYRQASPAGPAAPRPPDCAIAS